MNHTPGPWRPVFDRDEYGAEVETESRGFCEGSQGICNCRPEDAKLIAAAPDMAEALKLFVKQWNACGSNSDFGRYFSNVRDAANAALVKAGL